MVYKGLINMIKSLSLDSGTVTSSAESGTTILADKTKRWGVNKYRGRIVRIIGGSGTGQLALIKSNNTNSLRVSPAWVIGLDATSIYVIYTPEVNTEVIVTLGLLQDSGFGLATLKVLINAIEGKLDGGTYGLAALKALLDAILEDTGTTLEAKLDALAGLGVDIAAVEAKLDLATPGATFSYLDVGGEQTIFTFAPTKDTILHTIWLDLFALTQNSTIRLKHQIDGATYRTFETLNWTTGMDDGVYFRNIALMAARPLQVTMQETADESAPRSIPYYYVYEERT